MVGGQKKVGGYLLPPTLYYYQPPTFFHNRSNNKSTCNTILFLCYSKHYIYRFTISPLKKPTGSLQCFKRRIKRQKERDCSWGETVSFTFFRKLVVGRRLSWWQNDYQPFTTNHHPFYYQPPTFPDKRSKLPARLIPFKLPLL